MQKIENLSSEQEAKLDGYYEKWLKIGTRAVPTTNDMRERAEKAIREIYSAEGMVEPKIIWTRSPLEAANKCLELGDVKENLIYSAGYGSQDASWLGFYDFMQSELGLVDECKDLLPLMDLAEVCGWWWPYENICVVSELPLICKVNERGDLHSKDGPSIQYADGFAMYHLNGVEVSKEIAERRPEDFTKEMILSEQNVDIRREIIRKVGNERVVALLGASALDEKYGYSLLVIDYGDKRGRPHLKMTNPSIGTLHIEGVKPECKTVLDAIEFRNGVRKFPRTMDGIAPFAEWPDLIGDYDQQGDALFFDFDGEIPKDAIPKADNVAVNGLKRHVAIGDGVRVFEGYIDAPSGCVIKHGGDDHDDTHLKPGKYRVTRVQEYDHALEESRAVVD